MELPLCIAALAVCFVVLAKVRKRPQRPRIYVTYSGKVYSSEVAEVGFWYVPDIAAHGWVSVTED